MEQVPTKLLRIYTDESAYVGDRRLIEHVAKFAAGADAAKAATELRARIDKAFKIADEAIDMGSADTNTGAIMMQSADQEFAAITRLTGEIGAQARAGASREAPKRGEVHDCCTGHPDRRAPGRTMTACSTASQEPSPRPSSSPRLAASSWPFLPRSRSSSSCRSCRSS